MKISVIIPYYNGEKFIADAVRSLKKQSYDNFEVILINNGSTDNSEKIARTEAGNDKRFFFFSESKKGIANALNKGIINAKGECVSFLDCDDIYLENRLEETVKYIKKGYDFVACRGYKTDVAGNIFGETAPFFQSSEILDIVFMHYNIVNSLSYMMVKKNILMEIYPLPESYTWILDYLLMIYIVKKKKKLKFINKILVKRIYHEKNHSLDYSKIMNQVVPLLVNNYDKDENLINILTKKYIMGVQYLRRNHKMNLIESYLKSYIDSGYIKQEIYSYFYSCALFYTDYKKFQNYVINCKIKDPLSDYIRAYYYFSIKEYEQAVLLINNVFNKSKQKYPEIMNIYALSLYFIEKDDGKSALKSMINFFPDYRDAHYNLNCIYENKIKDFKTNIFLTEQSLNDLIKF